jgi:hypothetical protein
VLAGMLAAEVVYGLANFLSFFKNRYLPVHFSKEEILYNGSFWCNDIKGGK